MGKVLSIKTCGAKGKAISWGNDKMIVYMKLKEVLIEELNRNIYFEIFYPLMQVNKLIKKTKGSFSDKRYKSYKTALNNFLDISIDLNLLKEIIPKNLGKVNTHLGTYDFLDMDITSMGG